MNRERSCGVWLKAKFTREQHREFGLQPKNEYNTTDIYGVAVGYGDNRPSAKLMAESEQLQNLRLVLVSDNESHKSDLVRDQCSHLLK